MLQWLEGGEFVSVTSGNQPVSQWDKQNINQAVRWLTNQPTSYSARKPVIQSRRVFKVEITHGFRYCIILQMQHKWQQWDRHFVYSSVYAAHFHWASVMHTSVPTYYCTLHAKHFTFYFILLLRKKTLMKCLRVTWENWGKPQDMLATVVGVWLRLELAVGTIQPSNT